MGECLIVKNGGGSVSYTRQQSLTTTQKQQAKDNIAAMGKWVLLWTNASPSSSFAAQTISIDLSGYDFIAVLFERGGVYLAAVDGNEYFSTWANTWNGGATITNRSITAQSIGVVFADAHEAAFPGPSYSVKNTLSIPWAICGIKGVQY